jgi:hypothetical protein
MRPLRALFSARSAAIVGLAGGLALAGALSYEQMLLRHERVDPAAAPRSATPSLNLVQSGTLPSAANSSADRTPASNWVGLGNPLWADPVSSFTATRERPIFSPSRRPPPVVELASFSLPTPTSSPPQRPLLALIGAIAGQADGIAIFFDETTRSIVRLKTGESHSGWTLRVVASREATLQRGRETAILVLQNPPAR